MTRVALLWHMHQPYYEDLATHEHILPWVRLHALKDYYGMAALLREFPAVRMTFNLVPSLLVQLEAFAAGRARDRFLELSLKPAAELDPREVAFVLENFFHAQRRLMIDAYPRYGELLARREAAVRFSVDELRDLQVWHKLAWVDPLYLDGDARIRALVDKGRGFSEDDKAVLREVELELLNRVIPEYRAAAERGQIEVSASPFYHPILPLLCDSDVYLRTHPDARRPRQPFRRPEDAAEQLERASACHARLFGRPPVGLWPSEGSVSDAIVPLVAASGFRWMATDELILARTLGIALTRDSRGQVEQPDRLYAPYIVRAGGAEVACLFRDHVLSDLIGFTYSGWPAQAAADDFVARLAEAGRRYAERTGGGEAVIPIILDGENAWEHFDGGGRPFLRALYQGLAAHPDLRTVTMTEACAGATRELNGIFPGSWIDANFYIWIGHADDQKGWSQLADARAALDAATASGSVGAAALAEARDEIMIAEGSDWFWWYGDDHSSAQDLEFDNLFRLHLRNAYRRLNALAPDELFASNISTAGAPTSFTAPTALLAPVVDGEETSYFEWLGAGVFEVRESAGAMHQISRQPAAVTLVHFGFGDDRLYVRIDVSARAIDLLAGGRELALEFVNPAGVRFSVRSSDGRLNGTFWDRQTDGRAWLPRGPGAVAVAVGTVLELAIPINDLGTERSQAVRFFVTVSGECGVEIERHPADQPIETAIPDGQFAARRWRV
jgi:alpha-amylase/alpha-mannosidase (GH57 family)